MEDDILSKYTFPDDLKNLSYKDLDEVAFAIRKLIIEVTSKNGGHLAPALGVVELTLALLRSFDIKQDKIFWDVGHQSYAYKILTGRKDQFSTLRKLGGISGFSRPEESEFDFDVSGHASVSISHALGAMAAFELARSKSRAVAVIGDGALTGGVALEALNNLASIKRNTIVILNDNEMSISQNVGGFSAYLSKLMTNEINTKIRYDIQNIFEDAPFGQSFLGLLKGFEKKLINAFSPGTFFENLSIRYIGPINGHDIKEIEAAIKNAKLQKGAVLIHVATKKGYGYEFAEKAPDIFHGVGPFNIETGELEKNSTPSWTSTFSNKLVKLAKSDSKIVAITAAMPAGTGLSAFKEHYPSRFFDVGIAEQHAVAFAAGLAGSGFKPYVAIYSTFLQRAYDQIIHDVAISKLNVTFCIDRAGFVGSDGSTHHGIFDISFLRPIPNLTIMLPKDRFELDAMLDISRKLDTPKAIRYARGTIFDDKKLPKNRVELGEPEIIFKGKDALIISVGHIFSEVYKAYIELSEGFSVGLINLRFLKPLNLKPILMQARSCKAIFIIEEGAVYGGAGEMLEGLLQEANIKKPIRLIGIPDRFVEHGSIEELRAEVGLDSSSLVKKISLFLNRIKKRNEK